MMNNLIFIIKIFATVVLCLLFFGFNKFVDKLGKKDNKNDSKKENEITNDSDSIDK